MADTSLPADTALVRLTSCDEYLHADDAMRDLASQEAEHPAEEDLQVVSLTADSLETLKSTHRHYFADSDAANVLTVVAEA